MSALALVAALVSGWVLSGCGDDPEPSCAEPCTPPDPEATGDTAPPQSSTADTATPPAHDDVFLWASIRFDDAVDLGFEPGPVPATEQVAAGPVTLTEVGVAAGLATAVGGGNSHGVGIGFVDVDGDGWEDLVVANGYHRDSGWHLPQLWHNDGDGTFSDRSDASNLRAILFERDSYSVAAADYDADGDVDLHIGAHPTNVLLRNDGTGVFTDATAAAGVGGPPSSRAANGSSKIGAFGDYDGDGLLDLFTASSTYDANPLHASLMRNNGDGTFEDTTAAMGVQVSTTGNPCAVLWTDMDNDGDQDLWVWNDRGNANANRTILRNDGTAFTDVTAEVQATNSMGHPMGIDGADVDRDGFLDYYLGNIGGNALLMHQGGVYVDFAAAAGVLGTYGWGLGFEDLNADGWWDLFAAEEDDRPYLTFTHLGTTPPTFAQQQWPHAPVGNGHNVAAAFADYDHDGTVDVATAPISGGRVTLYRNDTDLGTNRWLEVRVPQVPGTGARGGVTARIVVATGDLVRFRDITGGSSRASQSAHSARFGLGAWTGADWVAALWPDGRQVVVTGVEGDRVLELP